MRVRTRRLALSAVAGVVCGSLLTFLGLVSFGRRLPPEASPTPVPIPIGTPKATAHTQASPSGTPSPITPAPSPAVGDSALPALGIHLMLPAGYRVAETLNTFTAARTGGTPRVVLTKAPGAQEEAYVALLRELYEKQVATEPPEFLPGRTITLSLVADASEQTFAAQLAKTTTALHTPTGLSGTRYGKVEGSSTYDAAYLALGGGKVLAVTMAYGVDAPQFDEAAYVAVINGIRPL